MPGIRSRCKGISAAEDGRRVTVRALVTNIGETFTGKEVAQLYVSAPNGALDKEYQSGLAAPARPDRAGDCRRCRQPSQGDERVRLHLLAGSGGEHPPQSPVRPEL